MENKKQGSDSESTVPTANNHVHQQTDYVRSQEEALNSTFSLGNIAVNSHIENDFATLAGSHRQDLEDDINHQTKPPRRPMTSYNIFFLLERERIISGGDEKTYTAEDARNMVALQKWRDVHFKRKHRKSHGMITFKDLSIRAAAAWKKLDVASKKIFHDCAAIEKANYARELIAWKNSERRQRRVASPIPRDELLSAKIYDQKPPSHPIVNPGTSVASMHHSNGYMVGSGYNIQNSTSHIPLLHPDIDVTSTNYHQYYQSLAGLPATIQFPGETNLTVQSSGETTTSLTLLDRRGSGDSLGSWVVKGEGEEGTWCSSTGSPALLTAQKTDPDKIEQEAMMDDETVGTFNP